MNITLPPLDLPAIESQLQQRGACTAVQWLLDCGELSYGAYEAWRRGQVDSLEAALDGDRAQLLQSLREAESCAAALKLASDPQPFFSWGESAAELCLSRDAELARLLAQRWLRPQDLPQLDLFMDGAAAGAENALALHLGERQWQRAQESYRRLCELAPDNPSLGGYEMLLLYGQHLQSEPPAGVSATELAEEQAALESEIAPLARDLLRGRAGDYLALAWRRLAEALPAARFDPHQPRLHPSHAWAQIPDWARTVDSVLAVPGYPEHPLLLQRLALALWHGRRREAALLLWAHLCELAPADAEEALETQAPPALHSLWREFCELEELPVALFPAWLLLCEPGLAHHFHKAEFAVPGGEAVNAVRGLLQVRARKEDEVAARKHLQARSPALLKIYLASL